MNDKVFSGFVIAVSGSMLGAVYGTFASEAIIVNVSIALGLVATAIGWIGFIRALKSS